MRNPDYPRSTRWDGCDEEGEGHVWEIVECDYGDTCVRCVKCECPGERQYDGSVYWPTT